MQNSKQFCRAFWREDVNCQQVDRGKALEWNVLTLIQYHLQDYLIVTFVMDMHRFEPGSMMLTHLVHFAVCTYLHMCVCMIVLQWLSCTWLSYYVGSVYWSCGTHCSTRVKFIAIKSAVAVSQLRFSAEEGVNVSLKGHITFKPMQCMPQSSFLNCWRGTLYCIHPLMSPACMYVHTYIGQDSMQ